MTEHGVAELRFKPRALGRHDSPGVGDSHQILNPGGEHGERARIFPAVHDFLELLCATNAPDEIDAFARARVFNAEERGKDVILKERNVEFFQRLRRRREPGAEMEPVPFAGEIKSELMFLLRLGCRGA